MLIARILIFSAFNTSHIFESSPGALFKITEICVLFSIPLSPCFYINLNQRIADPPSKVKEGKWEYSPLKVEINLSPTGISPKPIERGWMEYK
jgi:hypothetical protein